MGGCISYESDYSTRRRKPCANLVSVAGDLRQYPVPVTVSQVLNSETSSPDSFFVCNSDGLDFDDFIPSLDLEDELEPAQIYFVLPVSKLKHRLVASDMAELAVKASVALGSSSDRQRNRKARVSPVLALESGFRSSDHRKSSTSTVSKSGSVRRFKKGVKLATRSFRIRLSTIAEGSELLN